MCFNKTEDLNLSVFNSITGINESKTLTKHISCEYKCKLDGRKCNSNQKWDNHKCWCECKKHYMGQKDYIWIPVSCRCKYGKYLGSVIDKSMIKCDKIIDTEEKETFPTIFNERKATCKTQNLDILLGFLLITIALLILAGLRRDLRKYQAKQRHFLLFHVTNN